MIKKALLTIMLTLCLPAAFAQGQADASLAARLDSLVGRKLPAGSNVGICVYDLTAGKALYAYQADKLSRPASTMKLLTSITALDRPEADDPFRTEVWYTGEVAADTLRGDLYVVGGYDPEFDDAALDSLVSAVARLPFSVIQGNVYGDVSLKDSLYWGSGWAWDDTPAAYQPYLSPLMLEKGVVTVTARPGSQGEAAEVECVPRSTYYIIENRSLSRTPAAGRFRVSRNWLESGNRITVTGNVEGRRSGTVNVVSSQDFFMHTFVERLQARGVQSVGGGYGFKEFCAGSTATLVASYETPMQEVVNQLMKESDNLNAEAILCRLGAQSTGKRHITAEDGLDAIRLLIKRLGYSPERYNLADGSGLSNYNYISPELLVAFLRHAYGNTALFRKLYKALPIGGVDGTLKNRMRKGTPSCRNVHAKTGSFTAINCLAGYLQAQNGHQIAFAIMNQNVLSGREARAFQDRVCDEIIRTAR